MIKKLLANISIVYTCIIFLLLVVSVFAEPGRFSLVVDNITPIRLLSPIFAFVIILINIKKLLHKKNNLFLLIFVFFIGSLCFTLVNTLDLSTGIGIVLFWINVLLFFLAVYVTKSYLPTKLILFLFYIISAFLLFAGFLFRYISYILGSLKIFYPGFFIDDGNHMAFFISIIILFFYIFYLKTSNEYFKFGMLPGVFLISLALAACNGLGANLVLTLGLFCVFLYSTVYLNQKIVFSTFLFYVFLLFGFAVWDVLPKNKITESPYFRENNTRESVSYNILQKKINSTSNTNNDINYINSERVLCCYNYGGVVNFYSNFKFLPASVFAHATLIYTSVVLFLNKPWFGWGLGSYNEAMQLTGLHNFFAVFDPSAAGVANYPAHTMYGSYLAETGIFGFLGYISLFAYLFYLVIKKYKKVPKQNFNLKLTYFGYILTYLAYFAFTFIYNLHEEFIILPMVLMALGEDNKKINMLKTLKNFKSTLIKYLPIFNKYMLLLMILTSFILEHRLIPFNPNLNYIRYAMVLFIIGNFIYLFITKTKIIFDKLFYVILGFGIFKLFSIIYSVSKFDTIVNSFYWLGIALLYLILKNYTFLSTKRDLKILIVTACIISSFFSYLQIVFFYFFNLKLLNFYGWIHPFGFRVTGLSFDANHLAAFTLLGIFISLYYLITVKSIKYKILNLFLLLYFLPVFYYSSSRSALVGVFFGFFIFVLWFILKYTWFEKFAKMYLLLIPIIFVSVFLFFYPTLSLKEKGEDLGAINEVIYNLTKNVVIHGRGLDGSAFAHFSLIYSSFYLADNNYYLGAGSGNFDQGIYADKRLGNIFNSLDPSAFDGGSFPAHSMYGEALGEGGVVGIVLFCTILLLVVNKYLAILKYDKSVFPFFIYFYSVLFFMLFYNINEEFFWLFSFIGLSLKEKTNNQKLKTKNNRIGSG